MSEEYRSGPGTIVPTLFIGLGGTGSRIVDRVGGRAAQLPNWESQLRPLTSFVSIDTNERDQHQLRNVPEGNRLNMGAFDKATAIERYRPLAGWRQTRVTQRRTKSDWAWALRDLLDGRYADAKVVVLVMDNLNTHSIGS